MNKLIAALALLSVLFLAGCTSKAVQTPTGSGLDVISFNAPAEADATDTFSVDLVAQNIGDSVAKNIKAELVEHSNFGITNDAVKKAAVLFPPVAEKNVPGEEFVTSWVLKAPQVLADQQKSVVARITYDYSSNATSNIYVVPKDQYNEKGAASFQTYSTSSNGPVLISIQPLPAFKIRAGQQSVDALVVLTIQDVGSGAVVGNLHNFRLILTSGGTITDKTSTCSDVAANGDIQLLGREHTITVKCSFQLPASDSAISYIVDASADYTYYVDTAPASITVKK